MVTRNITILKKYSEGVTFIEALKLAEGKRLISNKEADEILQDEEAWKQYKELGWFWTDAMIAYPASGEAFGKYIKDSSTNWIVDVPEEAQGVKGKALLIEKNIKIVTTKLEYDIEITIVTANKVTIIPFKDNNGWYIPDEYGIPNGKTSDSNNKEARYIYRRSEQSLRPVSRYDLFGDYFRRGVGCYSSPDFVRLGVGVVASFANT